MWCPEGGGIGTPLEKKKIHSSTDIDHSGHEGRERVCVRECAGPGLPMAPRPMNPAVCGSGGIFWPFLL